MPRLVLTQAMKVKRWGLYLVNLNPAKGTKPGKVRPVVVIQDDVLNQLDHPSTVILPISSQVNKPCHFPLRVFLPKAESGLEKDSVILVDQIMAWDNRLFLKELGFLSSVKTLELESACREFFGW